MLRALAHLRTRLARHATARLAVSVTLALTLAVLVGTASGRNVIHAAPAAQQTAALPAGCSYPSVSVTDGPYWGLTYNNFAVNGSCFTPGGQVLLRIFNWMYYAYDVDTVVTASSPSWICNRWGCFYLSGGTFTYSDLEDCRATLWVDAYDYSSGLWSNRVSVSPTCS